MLTDKLDYIVLQEVPKKTPDELLEDLMKVMNDAGYGMESLEDETHPNKDYKITITIVGRSEYGPSIIALGLKK